MSPNRVALVVVSGLVICVFAWMTIREDRGDEKRQAPRPEVEHGLAGGASDAVRSSTNRRPPTGASNPENVATRRFEALQFCVDLAKAKVYFGEHPEQLVEAFVPVPASNESEYDKLLRVARKTEVARMRAALRKSKDGDCSSTPEPFSNGNAYKVALAAAISGNQEAARCYVVATMPGSETIENDPAAAAEYRTNARRLIADGIGRGDWSMVTIARYSENPRTPGLLRTIGSELADGEYGFAYLQYLGSTDPGLRADGLLQLDILAKQLTEKQRAESQAKAESIFARNFAGKPPYNRSESLCSM